MKKKIAIITDDFMYNFYNDGINELFYISNDNFEELLTVIDEIDFFLYVSGWKGMYQEWVGITNEASENNKMLKKIILEFRKRNIKTVFQTIEDPPNFNHYLSIARLFDYIFTSSTEMIDEYKKVLNHENVFYLEYGVNPKFHNPIKANYKIKDEFFFAGSWANRYVERCEDMQAIFDGVLESQKKLLICDRNFHLKDTVKNFEELYMYPIKYNEWIKPPVDHTVLQKMHKDYLYALNFNSVKFSDTMCAMRVYELQAIGNIQISNYSKAISNKFPNIFLAETKEKATDILRYSHTDEEILDYQMKGFRNVFLNKTTQDITNNIRKEISGLSYDKDIKIGIIINNKQSEPNESIQVLLEGKNTKEFKSVKLVPKNYTYVIILDDSKNYSYAHLDNIVCGFIMSSAKYLCDSKASAYYDFCEQNDVIAIDLQSNNEECFNYPQNFIIEKKNAGNKLVSVIIPVYDNGDFLKYRCIPSLKRCKNYENMEIILIDDGSKCAETLNIIKEFAISSGFKTFSYTDGGSGSASRPRNKGVELATSKYIMYLDPDNEVYDSNFDLLIDQIQEDSYDFVIGQYMKIDGLGGFDCSSYDFNEQETPGVNLIKNNFKVLSMQGGIFTTSFLKGCNFENIENAIGQDTLFFEQLMLNAKKIKIIPETIHIYYAERNGSAVNKISKKFFERSIMVERSRRDYGIANFPKEFENYCSTKGLDFFLNWYYEKFKLVEDESQKDEIITLLFEIIDINQVDPRFKLLFAEKDNEDQELALEKVIKKIAVFSSEDQKFGRWKQNEISKGADLVEKIEQLKKENANLELQKNKFLNNKLIKALGVKDEL